MADAPDIVTQVASIEGSFADALLAPLGVQSSQRPRTPLELVKQAVAGGTIPLPGIPGQAGQQAGIKLPPLPAIPGITSKAPPTPPPAVGAQATQKLQTEAGYF